MGPRERDANETNERDETEKSAVLANVARAIPKKFTGADIYALCADAWMRAAKRAVALERVKRVKRAVAIGVFSFRTSRLPPVVDDVVRGLDEDVAFMYDDVAVVGVG